ncbi:MAG: hypothetical protein IRZ13_03215 [Acetobacteraceae bacterium]|nr:hypothetical protein [Acetobacteraceae bacterium]
MNRSPISAGFLAATLALAIAAPPLPAAAQAGATPTAATPRAAFEARTVADLAALCGASPQAPEYASAIAFCHGFLQGAGQYHAVTTQPGSGRPPLFCPPTPPPTRAQVADAFVAWARTNPQYATERAVDGLARWAHATYPCPEPVRQSRSRAR